MADIGAVTVPHDHDHASHAPGEFAGDAVQTALSDRAALIRRAFALEYVTIAWMVIEAAVAIWSAVEAHSLILLAFGIDSLIELVSAGVLVWRLTVELRHGRTFAEATEARAARIGGALLFSLAVFVVVSAGWKLWMQVGAEFSLPGLVLSALAIPIMYILSREKLRIADAIKSRALRADAIESVTCGWLSVVVVVGLIGQLLFNIWWIDPVASLAIVWFLVREGREAWSGDECCHDH
jgi:divalent metal cation (Fe/Co/Zn/Cd) transporter